MPTYTAPARRSRAEDRSQALSELLVAHRAKLIAAVVILALIIGGALFYRRSVVIKQERAETAYFRARQPMEAGNYALAETDLRSALTRYPGTTGGTQAGMALAQVLYHTDRHADGIAVLRELARTAPRDLRPDVHLLLAAGHEDLNQFLEAAQEYERAAELARFPQDSLLHRASAARAYMSAGRNAEALAIWRELEDDPSQIVAPEARVRIGEIMATANQPQANQPRANQPQ